MCRDDTGRRGLGWGGLLGGGKERKWRTGWEIEGDEWIFVDERRRGGDERVGGGRMKWRLGVNWNGERVWGKRCGERRGS